MDKEFVKDRFLRGQDCSQVVFSNYAARYGLTEEQANKLTASFGGGSGIGETCGAVVGAMMVIGMEYGHKGPDDTENRQMLMAKRAEFFSKWKERHQTCMCRELLGYDLTDPEQLKIFLEKGLMLDLCPMLVTDAADILDEMLG